MQKYIFGVLLSLILILVACSNPEDKYEASKQSFNEDVSVQLVEVLNQLSQYESETTELTAEALTDESLEAFKNEESNLFEKLDQRQEAVDNLTEIVDELTGINEDLESISVDEDSAIDEAELNQTKDAVSSLTSEIQGFQEAYNSLLDEERSYYDALIQDDADYTTMTEGMSSINSTYEDIKSQYESVNTQISAVNGNNESNNNTEQAEESEEEVEPLYQVNPDTSEITPIEEGTDASVALITIDDAPDQHAVEMAHTLKELDAPAIFFVNGMYLESEEGKAGLKEIYDLGFAIGNHTYNHPNLGETSPENTELEIVDTNDLVEEVVGERPKFFRAPFGVNNDTSIEVAKDEGMTVMNWTYGYDWEPEYQEPSALAEIMTNTEVLSDGANLLMHDRQWTKEALPDIVTGLRDKGYTLVDPKTIQVEGGVDQ